MANGYELDYKKVHNTLGEPNKCKYGEDIGQYITDLWAEQDKSYTELTDCYQMEGILIENNNEYICSNSNFLYGSTYVPANSTLWPGTSTYEVKVFLIDLDKIVTGTFSIITTQTDTTIKVSKTELNAGYGQVHFKILAIKTIDDKWVEFNPWVFFQKYILDRGYSSSYYWTKPISLTENMIYTLTNEEKEAVYFCIFGYDKTRKEYVWIQDNVYHTYWQDYNTVFRCPNIGLVNSSTPTISGINPRVDQWYIIFYRPASTKFNYKHLFFESSIPLVVSQTGQIIKNIYTNNVIREIPKHTTDMYTDSEALDLLKSCPPVVSFSASGSPSILSISTTLRNNTNFLNWLIYKNYNIVLVTIRDHYNKKTKHQYYNDERFTVTGKRYSILKYIDGDYSSKIRLPTYEWTPSNLNLSISFNSLDDNKETIRTHIINSGARTCAVEQIPNQCQLCKWDTINTAQQKETHICFALALIKKNIRHTANNTITESSRHFINNGSHINMEDMPTNESYYTQTRCTLKSLL